MSTPTRNREHLVEAWKAIDTDRRLDALEEYFAPDYVRHSSEGDYDLAEYRRLLSSLHTAFPDLSGTLSEMTAEGDRVAYRWVSVGTHQSSYMGVPPTHKRITATGITISRLEGGRIVEEWASWNKVSVLHTLGIIPIGPRP
ncbi:MAG: hypothetical protein QOC64_2805 [Solirubrobacteraceae bacterium]|jgi:steroid delta-isomerase-like uncharacterized protein|nr:hypothetical protein [Solirubrobacteraceae bacterium]